MSDELEYGDYRDKAPTPLQERFVPWLVEKTGYNPAAAKTKQEAFEAGVRLAVSLRIPFQASPENREATEALRKEREEEMAAARARREEERAKAKAEREEAAAQRAAAKEEAAQAKAAKAAAKTAPEPAPEPEPAPAAKATPAGRGRGARRSQPATTRAAF
jgi:hypothetical protein